MNKVPEHAKPLIPAGNRLAFILPVSACLLVSGFFVYFPLTNTDIWWHLAAAREMLPAKSFLFTDPFSYTNENQRWVNIHWLFQLSAYGIYRYCNAFGLVAVKCIACIAAGVLLSFASSNGRRAIAVAAAYALLMYAARYLFLARPVAITMLCIGLYIFMFERYRHTVKLSLLCVLLPVQIVWVNSQGLFPLGPFIAGCYLLGDALKNPFHHRISSDTVAVSPSMKAIMVRSAIFACLIASCLINPNGFEGFLYPLKLFGRISPAESNLYSRNVSENLPLLALAGQDLRYAYTALAATALAIISFMYNKKGFRWPHVFLAGSFFYLALGAHRNVLLYFSILPVVIGYNAFPKTEIVCARKSFSTGLAESFHTVISSLVTAVAVITLLWFSYCHIRAVKNYPAHGAISPFRVPVSAVEYLRDHPVSGNIFSSIRYGGYLIWTLYPQKKVFIDGRLALRSPAFFSDYLALLDDPERFAGTAARYTITVAVLPIAVFDRYMALVKWLYESPEWDLIYADGESVLFAKSDSHDCKIVDLSDASDVASIYERIDTAWKENAAIRKEARFYTERLIVFLTGPGD